MKVGGASGPLYGTLFMALGKAMPPMPNRDELAYAFAAAIEAVKARGWTVVTDDVQSGSIEATVSSFWFDFKDDVMIRVMPEGEGSRIDVRSISRVGLSDLGANSKRVSDLLTEIQTRLN